MPCLDSRKENNDVNNEGCVGCHQITNDRVATTTTTLCHKGSSDFGVTLDCII